MLSRSVFLSASTNGRRLSKDQSGYNFDFRLLYKVLPRETAVVRFGGIRREGKWRVIRVLNCAQRDFYACFTSGACVLVCNCLIANCKVHARI